MTEFVYVCQGDLGIPPATWEMLLDWCRRTTKAKRFSLAHGDSGLRSMCSWIIRKVPSASSFELMDVAVLFGMLVEVRFFCTDPDMQSQLLEAAGTKNYAALWAAGFITAADRLDYPSSGATIDAESIREALREAKAIVEA